MLLLIANSKGGVGKTSLATSLLAEVAKTKSAIGIDLDSANKSASKLWSANRTEEQGKFYHLAGDIYDKLTELKANYDEVIIDAGGYDTQELRHAMLAADTVLIPLRVGANLNIEGFRNVAELADEVIRIKKEKGEVPPSVVGVVTCAPHLGSSPELDRAIQEIVNDPTVSPLGATIGDRVWYGRAVDAGLGLTEYQSPKPRDKAYVDAAVTEFLKVFKEIYNV
ncbi:nucleotide-binding protein [Acinetobacter brisouii]|uniref:nucleotide-binding protein n=1 Tax=Acinetobacter brisouii TaxID=396323 RepID=UPI00124CFB7A|nr:hypothetical protein [Acinetobacter brisouii]